MFFLQQRNYKQYLDKQFLTHFRSVLRNSFFDFVKIPLVLLKKYNMKDVVRRMSLRSLPFEISGMTKAGVTLESALVLPIFIFFVLNMFSVMEMLRLYGSMAYALNEVGGRISLYGCAYEQLDEKWDMGIIGDAVFAYWYVKDEIVDVLGQEYIENSPVVNGDEGLLFAKSKIMEEDLVELVVTYEMEIPFALSEAGKVRTYNNYCGRAWTGYDVSNQSEGWVYITESGTVYHSDEDCSYLKLSLQKVDVDTVKELCNKEGKIYTLCELCKEGRSDEVWITENGEKYHTSENCSGIKRTVFKILWVDATAKGYKLCSRCRNE